MCYDAAIKHRERKWIAAPPAHIYTIVMASNRFDEQIGEQ